MLYYCIVLAIIATFANFGDGAAINGSEPQFYCANAQKFPLDRLAARDPNTKWPQRTLVYEFDRGLDQNDRQVIQSAFQELSSRTGCLLFQQRSSHRDYVFIQKRDQGCYAQLGRVGGRQVLNLGQSCMQKFIAVHELIHAWGFEHEHVRPDRDSYVRIDWNNIHRQFHFAFQKVSEREWNTFGISYDYQSIMHYPWNAFAIDQNRPTITSTQRRQQLGGQELTQRDIQALRAQYQC